MLLERIEIDTRGPLGRVQLGPFSPGLNAVLGPVVGGQAAGTGDGARLTGVPVMSLLRALMLGAAAPRWNPGGWSGRIIWADTEGLMHCRRELDGTPEGRLAVEFEPREPAGYGMSAAAHASSYLRRRLSQLPPSIVEAVIAESEGVHPLYAALQAARRAGLDSVSQRSSLSEHQRREMQRLQTQVEQLQNQIDAIADGEQTIGQLQQRREQLQAEQEAIEQMLRSARQQRHAERTYQRGREHRLLELRDDARRLRDQESELRRNLAEIEAALRTVSFDATIDHPRVAVAETHRRQLEDLDSQLIRWRRTLAEVRGMRDQLARMTVAGGEAGSASDTPSADEWDARLEAAHRQIDWLTVRYAYGDPLDDDLETGAAAHQQPWTDVAGIAADDLTAQLRDMKAELSQLCTRLACGTGVASAGTLEPARAQLQRCESDLLASIARLVRHRHRLLRRIAQAHRVPPEQMAAAFGDWSHCQDHPHLYEWLLSEGTPARVEDRTTNELRARRLERDRASCSHELDCTVNRLENCLAEIDSLRKVRQQPLTDALERWPGQRRDAILAELATVSARLADLETRQRLIAERDQCRQQIDQIRPTVCYQSSLASLASHWLARLSGGRLQRIEWDPQPSMATGDEWYGDVRIDGRSVAAWSGADHAAATLALRVAAGDALAQRGGGVPLLVEIPTASALFAQPLNHRDTWDVNAAGHGGHGWDAGSGGNAWIETLIAYAHSGRQTILLTADRRVADRIANAGGRVQSLTAHSYAMPRAIYAYRSAAKRDSQSPRSEMLPQLNRDLDMAWREAYGFYDDPAWFRSGMPMTDPYANSRPCAEDYRDGAYLRSGCAALRPYAPEMMQGEVRRPLDTPYRPAIDADTAGLPAGDAALPAYAASPFFLTTDSPVDQAPSVDAVAADRLRGLGVTRVGHLLASDCMRLAEAMGMPDVSTTVVRRWQHEARLVCQVPQLRGFDARLLVGCGITDPQQLAAMHPGQLLEKVEAFLATDRGRQILRSGSSYELSRITSWIAAANRSVARSNRHGQRAANASGPVPTEDRQPTMAASGGRSERRAARGARRGTADRRPSAGRQAVPMADAPAKQAKRRDYYLDRHSPIVDAPSIGTRTATRLQQMDIHTVDDLLRQDPAQVADRLASKRIDANTVRQWQQQAMLMCRVPMLRDCHAAVLVAVGIHKPQQLAGCQAQSLLSKVRALLETAEGKRLLRGAPEPDLQQVAQWIRNAQLPPALRVA